MSSIIGYIRVSTEDQSTNFSFEAQETAIRKYCKENNLHLLRILKDVGTGKNTEARPNIKKLLNDANSNTIIISAVSRLGRNTSLNIQLFDKHKIISVSEGAFEGPAGKLYFIILSSLAEFELAQIKSRASASIDIKKNNYYNYILKFYNYFAKNETLRYICNELEFNRVLTPRGLTTWNAMQVKRVREILNISNH